MGFDLECTGVCLKPGQPDYGHKRSFYVGHVEAGQRLKLVTDSWKISSTWSLHETFCHRLLCPCRTLLLFTASWNGFYLVYCQMFPTFAMFTAVSCVWHCILRPWCHPTRVCAKLCDIFTTFITNVAIIYAQASPRPLDCSAWLAFWSVFYFVPHAIAFSLLLLRFIQPRLARLIRARQISHFVLVFFTLEVSTVNWIEVKLSCYHDLFRAVSQHHHRSMRRHLFFSKLHISSSSARLSR